VKNAIGMVKDVAGSVSVGRGEGVGWARKSTDSGVRLSRGERGDEGLRSCRAKLTGHNSAVHVVEVTG